MRGLWAFLVLSIVLATSCGAVTSALDKSVPCHDVQGEAYTDSRRVVPDRDGVGSSGGGFRKFRDCDLRCRQLEHGEHWDECSCSKVCICWDAAQTWNVRTGEKY